MKNIELIKKYYKSLSNRGRAIFAFVAVAALYLILEVVS